MKKILNNHLYDTDTARSLGSDSYSGSQSDFHWWREELYIKRTGEYFLYGEGGPMSRYARTVGQNEWSGGEKIMPLTPARAREWAEEHLSADEYEAAFGLPSEDDSDVRMEFQAPAVLSAQLRQMASERGCSLTDLLLSLIRKGMDA